MHTNDLRREILKHYRQGKGGVYIIGITGPGGAGKTTTGKWLSKSLGGLYLDGDDFMISRQDKRERGVSGYHPGGTNMDLMTRVCAELRRERPAGVPTYDFPTGEIRPPKRVEPKRFVIIAGVNALWVNVDYGIYLDMGLEEQKRVRFERDIRERGYSIVEVERNWGDLQRDYGYVEEQKGRAEVVLTRQDAEFILQ